MASNKYNVDPILWAKHMRLKRKRGTDCPRGRNAFWGRVRDHSKQLIAEQLQEMYEDER